MARIQIENISRFYGEKAALSDVSLDVRDLELMVFVGPSGCGKSTLLRTVAGFERPDRGEILIDGKRMNDVPPGGREIAMVFQNYALYPHMTAAENLGFCLKNLSVPKSEIRKRVQEVAQILQIEPLLSRKPHEMSGGQRQRVAIGRAIIRNPKLYLFDEPLSNLDALLRAQTRIELAKLHQRFRSTTIYVTHDQTEAMTLADRIAVMNAGRLEQVGPPLELYEHPKNLFVAGFLGSPPMNFIPGRVVAAGPGGAEVRISGGFMLKAAVDGTALPAHAEVTVGIRPENIKLGLSPEDPAMAVSVIERLGNRTLLYGTLEGTEGRAVPITLERSTEDGGALTSQAASIGPGDVLRMSIPAEAVHLFDSRGIALARNDFSYAKSA